MPFTLQVFAVLLAGMVLGPRLGTLSVLTYLTLGLLAPVYAGGASGLGTLLGPTGGYLLAFIPAVILTGSAATRGAPRCRPRHSGMLGLVPIYAVGATWLGAHLGLSQARQ